MSKVSAEIIPPVMRAQARALGIAVSYTDHKGDCVPTPAGVLEKMIGYFGAKDIGAIRQDKINRKISSFYVAWDGLLSSIWLWHDTEKANLKIILIDEDGKKTQLAASPAMVLQRGSNYRLQYEIGNKIPFGYYTLKVEMDGQSIAESFLISAPKKIVQAERQWGLFAPVYALQSKENTSIGGYTELAHAAKIVRDMGGAFFGTLPFLAQDYKEKIYSPYSPSTRLFWNEIFLDAKLPQSSDEFVDYETVYEAKKTILQKEADAFFDTGPDQDYENYIQSTPYINEYADFRAASEPDDLKDKARNFHLYCQYQCHKHLSNLRNDARDKKTADLYLDFPVGLNPHGFDQHLLPQLFMNGFHVGAPPDMLFSGGQDWGFAPMHPQAMIDDRFAYFRTCLSQYFRYARLLRLDHVMGLYRLYVIPEADGANHGAYIYYPFQAILAVLCLEAHLHDGILIGENLGTVPDAVQEGMHDHDLIRMWIFQFNLKEKLKDSFGGIENDMIACINTHDMFPLKSFLTGKDLEKLQDLKLLDEAEGKKMWREREKTIQAWANDDKMFETILKKMSESDANYVLIGLEDILEETEPQNIPGTTDAYPNWRKKIGLPVENWAENHKLIAAAEILNTHRQPSKKTSHDQ